MSDANQIEWLIVSVEAPDVGSAEIGAAILEPFAIDGIVVQTQQGDPNDLAPDALLPGVMLSIGVERGVDSAEFRADLATRLAAYQLPQPQFQTVADQDWANAWRDHYQSLRIGQQFVIQPSWLPLPDTVSDDDHILYLDPGMAFGTGTHETTQLCLALLEEVAQAGQSLLDVGCGSGILSIGAGKLGLTPILGIDIDRKSVETSAENAARNQITADFQHGTLDQVDPTTYKWDIVIANILAPVLTDLIINDQLVERANTLILSGILAVQAEAMIEVAETRGVNLTKQVQKGDWVALCFN